MRSWHSKHTCYELRIPRKSFNPREKGMVEMCVASSLAGPAFVQEPMEPAEAVRKPKFALKFLVDANCHRSPTLPCCDCLFLYLATLLVFFLRTDNRLVPADAQCPTYLTLSETSKCLLRSLQPFVFTRTMHLKC